MPLDLSRLHQVDDDGCLYISPVIRDWTIVSSYGVDTVIDLEGGLHEQLPDLQKLEAVVNLGAHLVASRHRVLSHCGMGFNRSALVAGMILQRLGMPGGEVVSRLRERRPGAAEYLRSLP